MSAIPPNTLDDQMKELFEAGAHFGYSRARRHPSAKGFIFGFKNKTAVINLEKTIASLTVAEEFVRKLGQEGKTLLLVGTKAEAKDTIVKAATKYGLPYVSGRWIGGAITNFPQIKKRLDRLADLKGKRERNELGMYTKKERVLIDREIAKLERSFSGIADLTKAPAAMLAIDSKQEAIAIAEARAKKIPVISISSTDCDISNIDYPIVANDNSLTSISFFVNRLTEAYQAGRVLGPIKTEIAEATETPAKKTPEKN